jgi:hypothetical protein
MNSLLNSSISTVATNPIALSACATATDFGAVLVGEAGVPLRPQMGGVSPSTERMNLMEVMQMLCPA